MKNIKTKNIYRTLFFICAIYFFAVAIAHQAGIKIPLLFIFYNISSQRYQDLIISFLSFGWAMLFAIGFLDSELRSKTQIPILMSGTMAICGLIRARMEILNHEEINYEIIALLVLLFTLVTAYYQAIKEKTK
jgi:hypothetical protein